MKNFILRLKALYWWYIVLGKNEFHPSLDFSFNSTSKILVIYRRELAHHLDNDTSLFADGMVELIEKCEL